jgi:uncharacterized membrane protein YoaK (UPF0700 family)
VVRRRLKYIRDPLPATLLALTFVTGVVDAVSFLGLGRVFSANQTGNVVFLGFAWAGASGLSATASIVSLLAFAAGAAVGGRLARRQEGRRHRWVVGALFGEAAMVIAATAAAVGVDAGPANARRDVIIALLALGMGLRNATVRRLGVPDLTTTVLTMTITGLSADRPRGEGREAATSRRAASILAMFVGALAGAALVVRGHMLLALILLSTVLLLIAAAYAAYHPPASVIGPPRTG